MKIKYVCLVMLSILFGIACLIGALTFMTMAKDLGEKVEILEMENQQLKWENENNYMYCLNEE